MGTQRATAAWTATGTLAAFTLIAVVDPSRPGRYPPCPTRLLTGLDCPACGSLRGLHALSRVDVPSALDHNLLLLVAVPLGAWLWFRWVRTAATGRPARRVVWPRWIMPAALLVGAVFTVTRNLPIDSLAWLDAS